MDLEQAKQVRDFWRIAAPDASAALSAAVEQYKASGWTDNSAVLAWGEAWTDPKTPEDAEPGDWGQD